ncbi:DeoR/GlpR family DNA-binding transcription regulator [Fulvimarina sp. MAC8]|uniref:DeoR/GlpR family DNA-binding transcription regulator n=1 Tax=Fulvimarina sp. MAC8 TaxID=3162874 RepID=UPI0032ED3B56
MTASRRSERLSTLRKAVKDDGVLHLSEAAERLGVSQMTVRRDLATAESDLACYGGHVFAANGDAGYRFGDHREYHAPEKAEACRRAAVLVEADDTLFIDCGTTLLHLARHLPEVPLTIICYGLNVALDVSALPTARLVLLGGEFHRSSASFSSPEALVTLDRIGINKAFISAGGVHPDLGASCSNFHEVAIKQAAIARAVSSYLVVDSSKLGAVKPARFADADRFERIVTEKGELRPDKVPKSV